MQLAIQAHQQLGRRAKHAFFKWVNYAYWHFETPYVFAFKHTTMKKSDS